MRSSNASRPQGPRDEDQGLKRSGADSDESLDRAWRGLANEAPRASFHEMRRRVEDARLGIHGGSRRAAAEEGGWNVNLVKKLGGLKALVIASLLTLAVACSVPVEVEENHGLELVATTSNPEALLDELKSGKWEVGELKLWEAEGGGTTVIATLLNATQKDLALLESLDGVIDLSSRDHVETVERSLFGAMMNNLFEVEVNVTGMTDAEVNAAINEQLAAQGFNGNVQIIRGGEDGRQLDVIIDDADLEGLGEEGGQIFIALDEDETIDGEGEVRQRVHMQMGNEPMEINGEMSDEQIRAQIIERLIADGVDPENASISISRSQGAEGEPMRVEVGVEVNEDE